MTNSEARKITYDECKVKCVACEEDCENMLIGECRKRLEALEQEPKTGHWIYENDNWHCSECGETPKTLGYVGSANFMKEHFKFCNHCGARMNEVSE